DGPESRVVFRADAETNEIFQLYSARLHGPRDVQRVSSPGHLDVVHFVLSAAGNRVVYDNDEGRALYSARADGVGPELELDRDDQPLPVLFPLSSDEDRVVSGKNIPASPNPFALFSRRLDGTEAAVRLNAGALAASTVGPDFVITPDGGRVVYHSDD